MKLLAYTTNKQGKQVLFNCSDGRTLLTSSWFDAVSFLLEPCEMAVTWNVDRLAEAFISLIPTKIATDLKNNGKAYLPNKEKLYYQVGRVFAITYGRETNIYALNKYADKEPTDIKELEKLGYDVLEAYKVIGIEPTKLMSPVSNYSLDLIDYPRACDLPDSALPMLNKCAEKAWVEWREVYKLGHWNKEEVSDYDLNCYSEDTEALTIDGWKYIKDLSIGEMILGFDKDKNKCIFQPVTKINIAHYDGEMYRILASKIDLLITPNHRILYRDHVRSNNTKEYKKMGHHHYGDWLIKEVKDTPNGNIRLPISFPVEDRDEYNISDDMLKLVAWINTEGWLHRCKPHHVGSIYIEQSEDVNSSYCNEILEIIKNLKLECSIKERQKPYTHEVPIVKNRIIISRSYMQRSIIFHIKSKSFKILPLEKENIHLIPMWILKNCSLRQLRLYYDTLMKGDGSRHYNKKNILVKVAFTTKLKENVDRMQYLCQLLGYRVNYGIPNKSHTAYNVYINETRNELDLNYHSGGCIKKEKYKGIVSCPTIETGFIVVRRNTKSCISGNSAYPYLISRLPDLRGARFFETDEMPDEEEYSWGELEGVVTITKDITPFQKIGTWEDSITSEQLWLINKYELGSFEFKHGWFFKLPKYYKLPFKETMQTLYKARQNENPLVKTIAKSISVGIGGKFAQRFQDGRLGDGYNSIYSRLITSRCAIKVCDFIHRNGISKDIISVMVDGFLAECPNISISDSGGMGSWRVNPPSHFLVASLLFQWDGLNTKHPNKLYYDDMMNLIKDNPNSSVYGDIDLNLLSHDRHFEELPRTGKDLLSKRYVSKPNVI